MGVRYLMKVDLNTEYDSVWVVWLKSQDRLDLVCKLTLRYNKSVIRRYNIDVKRSFNNDLIFVYFSSSMQIFSDTFISPVFTISQLDSLDLASRILRFSRWAQPL